MKQGKSIVELATEIEALATAKHDVVVDTREMALSDTGTDIVIGQDVVTRTGYELTNHAHRQIGDRVGIPAKYYDRMRTESPSLLADNVNHWFENKPERRMVRTLRGNARAFLSDKYRRIDNEDIAEVVLPILLGSGDIQIISSEITERRMYITAVFPRLEGETRVGRVVQSGVKISNSEIGGGGFNISPLVYELWCSNGCATQHAMKKYHVGRRAESVDGSYEIFTDETVKADDKALMLKVRDVVQSSMSEAVWAEQLGVYKASMETSEIIAPVRAIEVLTKKVGLSEKEGNSVLTNLIKDGDLTKYGLVQAVTAVANSETVSYDRAEEFQELGGKVLNLNQSEWQNIAEAA